MNRYGIVNKDNIREIVLLQGLNCSYGKCKFCDYVKDNSVNTQQMVENNRAVLDKVTGHFGILEVINSGNFFNLPKQTRRDIKQKIREKNIHTIIVENHYMHAPHLYLIDNFFNEVGCEVKHKVGVETFDIDFRENILNKGIGNISPQQISEKFDIVNLMVGIKGQTRQSILNDILIALNWFELVVVNVYCNNSTNIKQDENLVHWFKQTFCNIERLNGDRIEVLWHNTDYNVG